ncbi:MAG: Na(+)/H(+) antiporter subunit B [Bdellovibrionales bacterium RIFOXYC1_FULL_54_43]|nr:MAG: Na(+)/H(+) antiporter subunit B [Bdellovibrionales bacterium RIFOXYC1_FULL_54_43]OFZ83280.1 MAG: Na(+)/H(+) antiporter subunit B [Bdellovibrionales bacterium RIFOXYD1_FULL_55_31]
MTSLILRTASRFLITLLLLYSIFLLLRGHNAPGGGFVGGLVAASAWALYGIAFGETSVRKSLGLEPQTFIALGLGLAAVSGLIALFGKKAFLTGTWLIMDLEQGRKLEIGSPLFFDLGVYFVVLGTALTIILILEEEES